MGVFTKEEGADQAFLGITVKARAQDIFGVSNVVEEFLPFNAIQKAIQEEVLDRLNGAATEGQPLPIKKKQMKIPILPLRQGFRSADDVFTLN